MPSENKITYKYHSVILTPKHLSNFMNLDFSKKKFVLTMDYLCIQARHLKMGWAHNETHLHKRVIQILVYWFWCAIDELVRHYVSP